MTSEVRKVVVVTGASAGVGRATAVAFGRRGWEVGLIARGQEGLEDTKREIESFGGRAIWIQADVANAKAVMDAAMQIEGQLGPIEVWVNNAMVTIYARVVEITPEEYLRVTEVTYLGQVHGTLAALKLMRARNCGAVISVGSALAYRSIPLQAPYCAAKAATRAFMDSLRSELLNEHSAIRLTMVQLPAVNTPQFDWARSRLPRRLAPLPPIVQPEVIAHIAHIIVRAAVKGPREYWIGYSTLKAIIGQMLVPAVGDRILAVEGPSDEMTSQAADLTRPDNLYEAGRGNPGAHGRFDGRSTDDAIAFNPTLLRGIAGTIVCIGLIGATWLAVKAILPLG